MKRMLSITGLAKRLNLTRARVHQLVREQRMIPDIEIVDNLDKEISINKQYGFSAQKVLRLVKAYESQKSLPDRRKRNYNV